MIPEKFKNLPVELSTTAVINFDNEQDFNEFCRSVENGDIPGWKMEVRNSVKFSVRIGSRDNHSIFEDIVVEEPTLETISFLLNEILFVEALFNVEPSRSPINSDFNKFTQLKLILEKLSNSLKNSLKLKESYIRCFTCYNLLKTAPDSLKVFKVMNILTDIKDELDWYQKEIDAKNSPKIKR